MKKNKIEEKAREHFLRSQKEKARMGVFSFLIAKEKRQTLLKSKAFLWCHHFITYNYLLRMTFFL
jgi:hypothetical protein